MNHLYERIHDLNYESLEIGPNSFSGPDAKTFLKNQVILILSEFWSNQYLI